MQQVLDTAEGLLRLTFNVVHRAYLQEDVAAQLLDSAPVEPLPPPELVLDSAPVEPLPPPEPLSPDPYSDNEPGCVLLH